MMKKIFFAAVLSISLFSFSTQTSFAAENKNFFQKIQTSVSNAAQKLYLLLPGDKPGDVVMNQAVKASANLKSAKVNAEMTIDLQNNNQSLANIKLHADGPIKMNADLNYQQDLHFIGAFSMQGTTMQADADLKITEKKFYLKLNQVPVVPVVDLTTLKDRWLSFDMTNKQSQATWNDAQKAEFAQVNADLIKQAKYSSAQKMTKNDHAVYVVKINLPKAAVTEYVAAVQKIQTENEGQQPSSADMKEVMDKVLANVGDLETTVWIDRSTFYLRHIEMPFTYTKPADMNLEQADNSNPLSGLSQFQTLKLSIILDMDQMNDPITFEEPANAEDAQQVIQTLMTSEVQKPDAIQTSELPNLTPLQKKQLEKYQQIEQ